MSAKKPAPKKPGKKPAERKAAVKKAAVKQAVEKKAPPSARSSRTPAKRSEPERVTVSGLRTLGDVEPRREDAAPKPPAASAVMAKRARALLEEEFERVLAMKEKLRAEARIGGEEKGRDALRQDEKLRGLISSLEGMNRFALKMGLITPAESRDLYAAAMKRGLHDGGR